MVFVTDVIPGLRNTDRRKGVYIIVFVGRRTVVHIVHPRYDLISSGMQCQRSTDCMMSVHRLLAAEHSLLHQVTADFVAKHLNDPTHVVQIGFRHFGAFRRLVGLYFRVDRQSQVHIDQRGINTSVFRKFQYGFVAARHRQDGQTHGI